MTLLKMIIKAMTFIALTASYIFLMIPVFQILFQEETVIYVDGIITARSLFDTMLGSYSYAVPDDNLHDIVLILHIFISNIFLLNYLIAILSTVFEDMQGMGLFAYNSNKYQYIERYAYAMKDEWGYGELVVHPPPFNYLTTFLLVSIFKNEWMFKASQIFSKCIFWMENCLFYITKMLVREILLVPWIYIRLVYNIIKVENNLLNAFFLSVVWLGIGPFYLVHGLCVDMYYYV